MHDNSWPLKTKKKSFQLTWWFHLTRELYISVYDYEHPCQNLEAFLIKHDFLYKVTLYIALDYALPVYFHSLREELKNV